MAAALQQSPAALQGRSPAVRGPSASISTAARALPLRFSSSIPSLRLPRSSAAVTVPRRRRGGATMMNIAAVSYAQALADVATSNGTLEATVADMEKVDKIFSDEGVYGYFVDPTVDLETKQELVDEIVRSSSLQPHTANILNILVDMKRMELVRDIAREFELCYNRITGTEMAVVTSVVPLESQHLAQIAKSVQRLTKANNVRIKTKLDPSLVAGFTVRYGGTGSKLIDLSAKMQLEEIARQFEFSDVVGSLVS